MVRQRSKSLSSLDIQSPSKSFRHQRVVCYQLYFQEQKARLGSLYPFLTQEQINLKIKEKWNHLENRQKQKYTKAVLSDTQKKKPVLKLAHSTPKCSFMKKKGLFGTNFEGSSLMSTSPSSVISSQEKVQDWLNDPKQRVHERKVLSNSKKYDGTQYALNYGIPEIIEETFSKATGILKNKGNSSERKLKSKQNSRVSFSPRSRKTNKQPTESKRIKNGSHLKNGQCTGRQKNTLIKDKDIFDFEEIDNIEFYIEDENPLNLEAKGQFKSFNKSNPKNTKTLTTVRESFNFEDCNQPNTKALHIKSEFSGRMSKRTLNIPENVKKRKSSTERCRVPNKPLSQQPEYENNKETCNNLSSKKLRSHEDISVLIPEQKHQPRTDTPVVKQRVNKMLANSKSSDSSQDDNSTDSPSFYRNRKGLLVGPILYDNNEHMPAELSPTNSDDHQDYYTNGEGLIVGPIITKIFADNQSFTKEDFEDTYVKDNTVKSVSKKNKSTLAEEVFPKQTKTYAYQRQRTSSDAKQRQRTSSDPPHKQRTPSNDAPLRTRSRDPPQKQRTPSNDASQRRITSNDPPQKQRTLSSNAPHRPRTSSCAQHSQRTTFSKALQQQRTQSSNSAPYVPQRQRASSSDAQPKTNLRQKTTSSDTQKTSIDAYQRYPPTSSLYSNGKSTQLAKPKDKNKQTLNSERMSKLNCSKDKAKPKNCKRLMKEDYAMECSLMSRETQSLRQKDKPMLFFSTINDTFSSAYFDEFHLPKPVSPINSTELEADTSVKDLDSLSSVGIVSPQKYQSKTTLAKVLSRMKQITSPNQLSLESSPSLLSPTLSEISELSSLSEELSNKHDNSPHRQTEESKPNLRGHNLRKRTPKHGTIPEVSCLSEKSSNQSDNSLHRKLEVEKPNLWSPNSQKKRRKYDTILEKMTTPVKQDKNLLCDMFEDLTPPGKKPTEPNGGRRLVASNKEEQTHNFPNMFEETNTQCIFF